jgi:hypothetical protein
MIKNSPGKKKFLQPKPQESFWKKVWKYHKGKLFFIVFSILLCGSYYGLRSLHIQMIRAAVDDVKRVCFENFGLRGDYQKIQFSGAKFWDLEAEIVSPDFYFVNRALKFGIHTDRIVISSNVFDGNFDIFIPKDIKWALTKGATKKGEVASENNSIVSWGDGSPNLLHFKMFSSWDLLRDNFIWSNVRDIDYNIKKLVVTTNGQENISLRDFLFSMHRQKKGDLDFWHSYQIKMENLVLAENLNFLNNCKHFWSQTQKASSSSEFPTPTTSLSPTPSQFEDDSFDLDCSMDVEEHKDSSILQTQKKSTAFGYPRWKKMGEENTSGVQLKKAESDIFHYGTIVVNTKKCSFKNNFFEINAYGTGLIKDDIIQTFDFYNDISGYSGLIDCYFKMMKDTFSKMPDFKGTNIADFWTKENALFVKKILKDKLHSENDNVSLHFVSESIEDEMHIVGCCSVNELFELVTKKTGKKKQKKFD